MIVRCTRMKPSMTTRVILKVCLGRKLQLISCEKLKVNYTFSQLYNYRKIKKNMQKLISVLVAWYIIKH